MKRERIKPIPFALYSAGPEGSMNKQRPTMATKKLRELRHNYKAAYTDYMNCVHALSIASLNGDWLTQKEILADETAFNALSFARRALIDELREFAKSQKSK